jgi:hypothetical protein
VLRLSKTFQTSTSPVRAAETQFTDDPGTAGEAISFEERLVSRMVSSGRDEWHVNPSTRPAVLERIVYGIDDEPSHTFTKTGTVPAQGEHVDVPFKLTPEAATELLDITLTWDLPDDLDLEVFRKVNGKLEPAGQSGNPPGDSEQVTITDPTPGDYVLRVVNYASVSTSFTVTAGSYAETIVARHAPTAPFERWTLTCERPDGTVLETAKVLVSRGDRVTFDLAECRRAW